MERIYDVASYITRTENLTPKEQLSVALELIEMSGIYVKPEVYVYLQEKIDHLD